MEITKDLRLSIIGAGSVGLSIIEAFALQGFEVAGIEVNSQVVDRGKGRIEKNIEKLAAKGKLSSEEKEAPARDFMIIPKNKDQRRVKNGN